MFEADLKGKFSCSESYFFTPHDVSNEQQIQALRVKGRDPIVEGRCIRGQPGGLISITNSIGDSQFDLLCDPETTMSTSRNDSPSVVVVASDGVLEDEANQSTYLIDVANCMAAYSIHNASHTAELIANTILWRASELDNCTVFAAIIDPKCNYQHNLIAAVFDGHFSHEVAELAASEFSSTFSLPDA